MKEYKCISCGYIEEAKKDCTCPKCGHRMYPTPYDRDEVLRKEIIGFIHALKQYSFEESDLDYANKEMGKIKWQSKLKPSLGLLILQTM